MLKSLISKFIYSFLSPEKKRGGNRVLRELLKLPILFDLSSFFVQLRYVIRIKNVNSLEKTSEYIKDVIKYNYSVTSNKLITKSRRAEFYYQISSLILNELKNKSLLIVGPRNVQELYMAWLYGFNWQKISAIDLYSAHPKIKIMDMHNLDYKNETFDCVVMAYTISYADDVEKVISEVSRVLKPNGIFSFGHSYLYEPGKRGVIQGNTEDTYSTKKGWKSSNVSGENIYKMLKNSGMNISFYQPLDKTNSLGQKQTSHHICAQKIDPNETDKDRCLF